MDKTRNRALTYSLLAHIRSKGQLVSGPIEIFVPLVKRALSKLNESGKFSGESIIEIKNECNELYSIDFPIPVLRTILFSIAKEINVNDKIVFNLHQDDSFQLINYAFTEFEETLKIIYLKYKILKNYLKNSVKLAKTENQKKPQFSNLSKKISIHFQNI
jgi:hypothetical protein